VGSRQGNFAYIVMRLYTLSSRSKASSKRTESAP
jgi:hypothetical protein